MSKNCIWAFVIVSIAVLGAVIFWQKNAEVSSVKSTVVASDTKAEVNKEKIKVSTSFYPLYYLISQIGGDKVSVSNITPAGAEPHDYEPTAQDMVKMEQSNLIVFSGNGFEAWADKVKMNVSAKKIPVLTAGEGLATQEVVEDGEKILDPHVWLAPTITLKMVDKILSGLIGVDPENTAYYTANANTLKSKITVLDKEFEQGLANCARKDFITSHAAFGYLASAYGLNQVAISGISPEEEPSPRELSEIAKFAKENRVQYIFFESLVSPKLSETVANEIGAKTLVLNPIEGLTPEELAKGNDYLSEMRSNLANLKTALQCTP